MTLTSHMTVIIVTEISSSISTVTGNDNPWIQSSVVTHKEFLIKTILKLVYFVLVTFHLIESLDREIDQ